MRNLALIALAYLALVLLGPLWRLAPMTVVVPNLAVVFAAYLGITTRHTLAAPVATAVAIGYLADLLGGTPPGLMSLTSGLACLGARALTTRLLVRGRAFVITFLFTLTLAAGLFVLGVRVFYGGRLAPLTDEAVIMIGCALVTALLAAPIFRLCRNLDARFARTEREREGLREGFLN